MDIEFQKRLLATFRIEAKEHLNAISAGLVALENAAGEGERREIVETVFREAHSMKGAARAVNMTGVESLSHALESVFARCKRELYAPSPEEFDLFHRAVDAIDGYLSAVGDDPDQSLRSRARELVAGLERVASGEFRKQEKRRNTEEEKGGSGETEKGEESRRALSLEKTVASDTVRISAGKLDSVFLQAEEMLLAKAADLQFAADLGEINNELALWEREWKKNQPVFRCLARALQGRLSADPDAARLGRLLDFFESGQAFLKSVQNRTGKLTKTAAGHGHALEGMVDNLLDDLKEVMMLPCSAILDFLPKMVRDLARDRGKDAEIVISGETVEIDKRVLEELKDPVIHLVRNCIEHGIEKPAERLRRNKPARGRISVTVSIRDASRAEIVVADDGAGIDADRVAEAAARSGMAHRDESGRTGAGELVDVIFRSGFSTSSMVSDISGRGLGLAIVREKVERLGGTVLAESAPKKGASFRMSVPLTLSTYRGVLVRASGQTFILPVAGVERVARVDAGLLRTVENRETIELDAEPVSFVRLGEILRLRSDEGNADGAGLIQMLVIGGGSGRIAFGVDAIIGEEEILARGLGPQLMRVRNISGATVLGDGAVALILHPGDLLKSAAKWTGMPSGAVASREAAKLAETARRAVLVAEDSITARTLLKNILETAGYRTFTAVDGMDALTALRTEHIDLVISDVDMPRMNGFDLTARIRASREFAELPVVLVTSLDSREDRERGMEAGANAYVVKSSFDQSNLLEVVKRLI